MSLEAHKGQILPIANTTIPLSSSTVFHAPFDDTLWGYNPSTVIKPLGFSNALAFNGVDTYAPLDYGKNLSVQPMTIEMWVRPNAVARQQRIFSIKDTVNNKLSVGWSSGKWDMAIGGSDLLSPIGTVDVNALAWQHVALVLDAGTAKLYVNGTLVMSKVYTTWTLSSNITLGCLVGASSNSDLFDGQISDVRIWSMARTVAQITSNYDTEFTMDELGLVRYFKLNQSDGSLIQDYSINGSSCRTSGSIQWNYGRTVATIKQAQGKYRGALEVVPVNGNIPKGSLYYPESLFPLDAFTFNAWFNLYQHDTTSYQPIFEYYDRIDTTKNRVLLMFHTTTDVLSLFAENSTGTSSGINGTWAPTANAWHMVTLVYDGTNYKIYGDGQLKNTSVSGNKPTRTSNHRFNLGGNQFGNLNGLLEDVRIDNRAVSEDEIIAWYHAGGPFSSFASPNVAY